jgi:hypothetical protein
MKIVVQVKRGVLKRVLSGEMTIKRRSRVTQLINQKDDRVKTESIYEIILHETVVSVDLKIFCIVLINNKKSVPWLSTELTRRYFPTPSLRGFERLKVTKLAQLVNAPIMKIKQYQRKSLQKVNPTKNFVFQY